MEEVNLTGHFLIAMPAMVDPYFSKSVTYICEHNGHGAMGIVINRPIDMKLDALLEQIGINVSTKQAGNSSVHFGGPVQINHGFVLHQPVGQWQSTIAINGDTGLTTSKDILDATAHGEGPHKMLITLGYVGWSAGQLEQELTQNAWLTAPALDTIIFDLPAEQKRDAAMSLLGVDLASLTESAGHA